MTTISGLIGYLGTVLGFICLLGLVVCNDNFGVQHGCSSPLQNSSCTEFCHKTDKYPRTDCFESRPNNDYFSCVCRGLGPHRWTGLCEGDIVSRCHIWCQERDRVATSCQQSKASRTAIPQHFTCICGNSHHVSNHHQQ